MPPASRLGDKANIPADAHGCPACPHPATGPAIVGSTDVFTNSRPAFRKDDQGLHAACCNTNMWKAVQGSGTVFINNKEAVRQGDQTKHCGGSGNMIEGSNNVMIGGAAGSGGGGGSGGGSSSAQGGGGTSGGAGSQSGINSNQTGGGGGGGAAGTAGGGRGGAGGGAGAGGAGDAADSSSSSNPNEKKEDKDVFTLWLELAAVNGGKLIGEIIDIIDPDTKEVVATTEVGEDGNVFVEVPKNKSYHVDVRAEHKYSFHHEPPNEKLLSNKLSATLYDEDGLPLPSGIDVKIKGGGTQLTVQTELGGAVSVELEPGTYELTVLGQTFVAETLSGLERQHPEAGPYEFQVDTEDKS